MDNEDIVGIKKGAHSGFFTKGGGADPEAVYSLCLILTPKYSVIKIIP
jgi:hypothetical protein